MRQDILNIINSCVKTKNANLSNLMITDVEILEIIKKINDLQPELTVINLDHNQLGDEGAIALSSSLKDFSQLSEISVQHNNIGKIGANALFSLKKKSPNLDILFHGNQISNVREITEIETSACKKYS